MTTAALGPILNKHTPYAYKTQVDAWRINPHAIRSIHNRTKLYRRDVCYD